MHQNRDKAKETRRKRLISQGLTGPPPISDAHDDDNVDFFRNRQKEIYNISLITREVSDKR